MNETYFFIILKYGVYIIGVEHRCVLYIRANVVKLLVSHKEPIHVSHTKVNVDIYTVLMALFIHFLL